jgi:hypothetical protein
MSARRLILPTKPQKDPLMHMALIKALAFSIAVAFALAGSARAEETPDGIGGWPLLHWGMSKQQVERAYPNFQHYNHVWVTNGGGYATAFGLKHYSAAGCDFELTLDFSDDKLYQINLETWFIPKGSLDDELCDARGTLLKMYGEPKTSNADNTYMSWTVGNTVVLYKESFFSPRKDLPNLRVVSIIYGQDRIPDQKKRL